VSETLEYDGGGSLKRKRLFKYDEKANVSEQTAYDSAGKIEFKFIHSYEYDEVGNWTKHSEEWFENREGKLVLKESHLQQRSITY
jgi:hypothetical protein